MTNPTIINFRREGMCSVCNKAPIDEHSNSARPVNDGYCCDQCFKNIVNPPILDDMEAAGFFKASDARLARLRSMVDPNYEFLDVQIELEGIYQKIEQAAHILAREIKEEPELLNRLTAFLEWEATTYDVFEQNRNENEEMQKAKLVAHVSEFHNKLNPYQHALIRLAEAAREIANLHTACTQQVTKTNET
jgi:hypothetical protein